MAEKLLINVTHEETRVALVEGGVLSNLEIDTSRVVHAKGNVYKGVVHRVNQSLQAAFVDYGAEKQGFLPVSEIHRRYHGQESRDKRHAIQDLLKEGQELMVQVVKDEIGNKGASLSTYVSLPGRYLVLMPDTGKTGISRRLGGDERKRLKKVIADLPVPDGFGVIIRTSGIERDEAELAPDLAYLCRLWKHLEERFKGRKNPGVIHQERSLALRFIRDYATGALDEIIVDRGDTVEEIRDFCRILMPEMKGRIRYYDDTTPLFSRYQIEDQIDDVFSRRIELPSGGSVVIDQTEALVAIDVNSGRVKTSDIEATALKTNLEAAAEIARQLKLRDLGGLVVVDFIDMRTRDNIREVEAASRDAFEPDKAKVKFSRISEFGLMEISRQRLKSSIMKGSFNSCDHCGGTGKLRSVESSAVYLLRRLKETVLRGTNYMHVSARMPVEVANYLLNRKRHDLVELERESRTTIDIKGEPDCLPTRAYVEVLATSAQGRSARRVLLTFDLVRSDVDKREMEHLEEVVVDAAQARGMSLTEDEYSKLYRRIEEQMARDVTRVEARHKSDKDAAIKRALDTDREERRKEDSPGMLTVLKGWFAGSGEEPEEAKDERPSRASSDRGRPGRRSSGRGRQQGSDRRRSGQGKAESNESKDRGRSSRRGRGGRRSEGSRQEGSRAAGGQDAQQARGSQGEDGKRRRRRRRRGRSGGGESQGADAPAGGGGRGRDASADGAAPRDSSSARGDRSSARGDRSSARGDSSSARGDGSSARGDSRSPRGERSTPRSPRKSSESARESKPTPPPIPQKASKPKSSDSERPKVPKAGGVIDMRGPSGPPRSAPTQRPSNGNAKPATKPSASPAGAGSGEE